MLHQYFAPAPYAVDSCAKTFYRADLERVSKTRQQIRDEFAANGVSYSAWARQRGYSPNMVIAIITDDDRNPRLKCLRGDAHNIAVELGLKEGQVFKGDAGTLRLAAAA